MTTGVGARFGPYEILSRVGAGGMGAAPRPTGTLLDVVARSTRRSDARHRDVHDAPPIVREHHEDEQQSAGRGRHHEEICRHDLVHVIGQERPPRLRGRSMMPHEVFRDTGLTHLDPELLLGQADTPAA